MKYVFVCRNGQHRSAIAARAAEVFAEERGIVLCADYLGVQGDSSNEEKREILADADLVLVMEDSMIFDVKHVLGFEGTILCLNMTDEASRREIIFTVRQTLENLPDFSSLQ